MSYVGDFTSRTISEMRVGGKVDLSVFFLFFRNQKFQMNYYFFFFFFVFHFLIV